MEEMLKQSQIMIYLMIYLYAVVSLLVGKLVLLLNPYLH